MSQLAALAEVPEVIAILFNRGKIVPSQHAEVTEERNADSKTPEQLAIERGYVTQANVDKAIESRALLIIKSAKADIQNLSEGKQLAFPESFKPDFGIHQYGGQKISTADAASVTANIAKNIVLLVKDMYAHPDKKEFNLLDAAKTGFFSCQRIAEFLVQPKKELYSSIQTSTHMAIAYVREMAAHAGLDEKPIDEYAAHVNDVINIGIEAVGPVQGTAQKKR